MAINVNKPAPENPLQDEFLLKEFLAYLADKYRNGHLLPDFPADPPNVGNQYRMYFNTTTGKPVYYNGTAWISL
jgi:hypothetical protein